MQSDEALTDDERNWLLTAATNRPVFAAYQEQVERLKARQDEQAAALAVSQTATASPTAAQRARRRVE